MVSRPTELWMAGLQTKRGVPTVEYDKYESTAKRLKLSHLAVRDAVAFGVFFGAFEGCKQTLMGPVEAAVSSTWPALQGKRRDLLVLSTTAIASGGVAGLAFTGVTFPVAYRLAHHGDRAVDWRRFGSALGRASAGSLLPNAACFLAMELLANSLDE